jgi:hypothetical protein
LYHTFPVRNGLKEVDALSQFLWNFALEYAIRKLIGTHQLLVYVDDVNLLEGT